MIEYNLDAAHSILYMQPTSALAAEDFIKICLLYTSDAADE